MRYALCRVDTRLRLRHPPPRLSPAQDPHSPRAREGACFVVYRVVGLRAVYICTL